MDNRLIFENYLLVLKSTVEVFVHGTLESSNNDVRLVLKESLSDIMLMQANTYNLMQNNNWYQTSNVKTDVIQQTMDKLEKQN